MATTSTFLLLSPMFYICFTRPKNLFLLWLVKQVDTFISCGFSFWFIYSMSYCSTEGGRIFSGCVLLAQININGLTAKLARRKKIRNSLRVSCELNLRRGIQTLQGGGDVTNHSPGSWTTQLLHTGGVNTSNHKLPRRSPTHHRHFQVQL